MNTRDAAQIIRDTVSMDQILGLYGYKPNRSGFMPCPFHGERNPSLKIYKGSGWHCFGCGRGGSVIDFVMEHEGCNLSTAVKAIDNAMRLRLTEGEDPLMEDYRRRFLAILDALTGNLLEQVKITEEIHEDEIRLRLSALQDLEAKPKPERSAQEWDQILILVGEMEYLEYKKQQCDALREEIIQWRQQQRRPPKRAAKAASA